MTAVGPRLDGGRRGRDRGRLGAARTSGAGVPADLGRPAPGRRAGPAGRGRPDRDAGLPAPADHARRDDGSPPVSQDVVAPAGARRSGGATVQHARDASEGSGAATASSTPAAARGSIWAAVLAFVTAQGLPEPWVVGWSFGTDVALNFGDRTPVAGAVLLSPPLRFASAGDLQHWAHSRRPLIVPGPRARRLPAPGRSRAAFCGSAARSGRRRGRGQAPVGGGTLRQDRVGSDRSNGRSGGLPRSRPSGRGRWNVGATCERSTGRQRVRRISPPAGRGSAEGADVSSRWTAQGPW